MFLQPPRQPYLIPQLFFPSHFYYQNYDQVLQPYFVNHSQTQIYVCDPFIYHVFPTYYFQRPPNPPINPRVLPQPRRNTRLKPKRNIAATTSGVRKWVPKRRDEQASTCIRTRNVREGSSLIPFPTSPYQQITSTTTTIMIKNIPNQFGRSDLLSMLKDHCLDENLNAVLLSETKEISEFDFLYLPMDFKEFWEKERISNLGYAFVNFTSSCAALRFYKQYHKFEWPMPKNKRYGKEALTKKFKNKIFWCHSNEYLPVILAPPCDGVKNSGLVMVGKLAGQPKILKKK